MPEAILLDHRVNGLEGLDVLYRIRHEKGLRQIPCFILSGPGGPEEVMDAYNLGAKTHWTKPMTEDHLEQLLFAIHFARLAP